MSPPDLNREIRVPGFQKPSAKTASRTDPGVLGQQWVEIAPDHLLDILEEHYLLRSIHPGFAVDRRAHLTFAVPCLEAGYSKVNAKGPDPQDYLVFAQSDLREGGPRGGINALSNAKRAIHLAIQAFLRIYCVEKVMDRASFPEVLQLLEELGAFPTRLVRSLNSRRNLIEHEYEEPSPNEVASFVEVAELFVVSAYSFFRRAIIGVYFGTDETEGCRQYVLRPESRTLELYEVAGLSTLVTPHGTISYNIKGDHPREKISEITIAKESRQKWLPIIELLVFVTRFSAYRLTGIGPPGSLVPTRVHFAVTDEVDDLGRRKTYLEQVTEVPERLLRAL